MDLPSSRDSFVPRSRWGRWKLALALTTAWVGIGLLSGVQAYFTWLENVAYIKRAGMQADNPLQQDLLWSLRPALTWALLTPGIWWLVRRFPPTRLRAFAGAQLAGLVACVLIQSVARVAVGYLLGVNTNNVALVVRIQAGIRTGFFTYAVVYGMTAGGLVAYATLRRLAAEREHSARLQTEAMRARLHTLQAQLQPHFLFNTLHAISTLVTESPPRAVEMIARLGELLREALQRGERGEVALQEELEFAERYLAIEQVRFGARLRVEWSIAPQARDVAVPPFFLQPLVENAVQHGIARSARAGQVDIAAVLAEDGTRLRVEVANTGPAEGAGMATRRPRGLGLSLANLRARLETIYGAGTFEISLHPRLDTGGAMATVVLPARRLNDDAKPLSRPAAEIQAPRETAARPC